MTSTPLAAPAAALRALTDLSIKPVKYRSAGRALHPLLPRAQKPHRGKMPLQVLTGEGQLCPHRGVPVDQGKVSRGHLHVNCLAACLANLWIFYRHQEKMSPSKLSKSGVFVASLAKKMLRGLEKLCSGDRLGEQGVSRTWRRLWGDLRTPSCA